MKHFRLLGLTLAALTVACDNGPASPALLPTAPFSQTDLRIGDGAEAVSGRSITVTYTGWIYDPQQPERKGRQFDTSAGGAAFTFTLGAGQVIRGWDQGLPGMRVGGARRLIIPPDLAFGPAGAGNGVVPPNATVVFDVELVSVQ